MRRGLAIIILASLGLAPLPVFAATGTVLDAHKYAWSNNVGYINFASVIVDDSTLSGSAWSTNKGFIKFNPAESGVINDGAGNLSGSAWGEQLGYIDFSGVTINSSTGQFSGTATGTLVGTITFDCPTYCDVATDWRPTTTTPTSSNDNGPGFNPPQILTPPSSTILQPLPVIAAEAASIDIVRDGIINILDFNSLMVNWNALGSNNIADMNKDGAVDILDFNLLMVYWGTTYQL